MKKIIQIALLLYSCVMGYLIYNSITGPIRFDEQKQKRYTVVIQRIKHIRDAQDACFSVTGNYAPDFQKLEQFIENGKFAITTQRDTSWVERDKKFNIDVQKQSVVIDTIRFVSVKDSIFKNSNDYKTMKFIPNFQGDKFTGNSSKTFEMTTNVITKNNYTVPVYEIKTPKQLVLQGLDQEEIAKELLKNGVNDVKGTHIVVGSLKEFSNSGNWPTFYDAKTKK